MQPTFNNAAGLVTSHHFRLWHKASIGLVRAYVCSWGCTGNGRATVKLALLTQSCLSAGRNPARHLATQSETRGFLRTLSVIKTAFAALQYFHGKAGTLASIRQLFLDP
jgi:hypothetical protein